MIGFDLLVASASDCVDPTHEFACIDTFLCAYTPLQVIAAVYPEVYPSDMPPPLARLEPSHEYIRPH